MAPGQYDFSAWLFALLAARVLYISARTDTRIQPRAHSLQLYAATNVHAICRRLRGERERERERGALKVALHGMKACHPLR